MTRIKVLPKVHRSPPNLFVAVLLSPSEMHRSPPNLFVAVLLSPSEMHRSPPNLFGEWERGDLNSRRHAPNVQCWTRLHYVPQGSILELGYVQVLRKLEPAIIFDYYFQNWETKVNIEAKVSKEYFFSIVGLNSAKSAETTLHFEKINFRES